MICHSEFISESNDSNDLATLEIPKQVRDDNCDTVCKTAGLPDGLIGGSAPDFFVNEVKEVSMGKVL
ncbi:MAG TPA: hypothetical protein ENH82_19995 [bacterium]|nr:hypothetical protein [bacterium]